MCYLSNPAQDPQSKRVRAVCSELKGADCGGKRVNALCTISLGNCKYVRISHPETLRKIIRTGVLGEHR